MASGLREDSGFWWRRFSMEGVAELLATRGVGELIRKAFRLWRREGYRGLRRAAWEFSGGVGFASWIQHYDTLTVEDRRLIQSHIAGFSRRPIVSVLMPVFDPPADHLRAALASMRGQLYPHWELCIADDASSRPHVRAILDEARKSDSRIKVVHRRESSHVSTTCNTALSIAAGQFVTLLDCDDELSEHALYMVAAALDEDPDLDLIYSDGDRIDGEGRRFAPYFKPAWNPDLMLGQDLTQHLGVFRSDLVRSLGGFREQLEGAQHWDLALRVEELTDEACIRHIPHILCHARAVSPSNGREVQAEVPVRGLQAGVNALMDCCARRGTGARAEAVDADRIHIVYPIPDPTPLVSIVVPTHNALPLLRVCLDGLFNNTGYPAMEIIVVNNRSDDPATLTYLDEMAEADRIRLLHYDAPFNYSAINNMAIRHASGELICLLNNDIEPIGSNWLTEMVGHALRPEIGAVGAMLYYPDEKIQHAGVFLNGFAADHFYKGSARGTGGDSGRARLVQNVSAVTAACLVLRRAVWDEVGGLDEERLAVAFNDVDLCLKVQQRGYRNLWTPFAELYHHESVSRGADDTPEKRARFDREVACLRERWGNVLKRDPALSPNHAYSNPPQRLACPPRVEKPWLSFSHGQ